MARVKRPVEPAHRATHKARNAERVYEWVETHPHCIERLNDTDPHQRMRELRGEGFVLLFPMALHTALRPGGPNDRRMYRAPFTAQAAQFAGLRDNVPALGATLAEHVERGTLTVAEVVQIMHELFS